MIERNNNLQHQSC